MRVKGKRGLAVCMAALLALSGLKVSAEELVQPEEVVETAAAVSGSDAEGEIVGSVSGGDVEEPGGETGTEVPEEVVETAVEEQEVFYAAGNLTSGDFGRNNGLHWEWDAATKTITVSGDDVPNGNAVWDDQKQGFVNTVFREDVEYIRFTGCTLRGNVNRFFAGLTNLKQIDFSGLCTKDITDMLGMFYGCSSLTSVDVSGFATSNVTDMLGMFYGCSSLTSVDVSGFDTSNVTAMEGMFLGCSSLTSVDVSGFDTSNVTYMSYMFLGCSSLTSLDVSGFDTSNVTDMMGMFYGCSSLTSVDVSGFATSSVTNMSVMFSGCSSLISLDLSSFDTDNVAIYDNQWGKMFGGCTNLKTIKTPHTMGTGTAELPATFLAPDGTKTQVMSKEFCNTILTREGFFKPAPVKFTVVGVVGGRNVTFNNDTEGTVIYYSSKTSALTTNDACVKPGETVLFENFYGTIYAKAYADGQWSNVSRLVLKIPVVNKPTITCKDGVVTIKTTTPNSYIYYTTDGSTPSPTNGKMLSKSGGSFTVPANCTVKAIAVRSCFTNSETASAKATARKLGAPSFAVKGVIGGREVTFNTTETKGEIYYSFTSSNITTKDLHVKPGEKVLFRNYYGTVYARTYVNGQWSNVSRLVLRIPVVNKPAITAAGNGKVKISTSTPNCAIYYTTDGSTPSPTHGTRINSSSSVITVGSGKTVRAIAVRSCFTNSEVEAYVQK